MTQVKRRLLLARLQMAYVFEVLDIVKDVRKTGALKDHIEAPSAAARNAYEALCVFIDSTDYNMLAEFRNGAAFHYDGKRAAQAVTEIAEISGVCNEKG